MESAEGQAAAALGQRASCPLEEEVGYSISTGETPVVPVACRLPGVNKVVLGASKGGFLSCRVRQAKVAR